MPGNVGGVVVRYLTKFVIAVCVLCAVVCVVVTSSALPPAAKIDTLKLEAQKSYDFNDLTHGISGDSTDWESAAESLYSDLDAELTQLENRSFATEPSARDLGQIIKTWKKVQNRHSNSMIGDYALKRVEANQRRLKKLAFADLDFIKKRLENDTFRRFDWEGARRMLTGYAQTFPGYFESAQAELRRRVEELEFRYGSRIQCCRLIVDSRQPKQVQIEGSCEVLGMKLVTRDETAGYDNSGAWILTKPGKSEVEICFQLDKLSPHLVCGAVLCCAQVDVGYDSFCDVSLNGSLLAGRWTPRAHHWSYYSWPVGEQAVIGKNVLKIRLHKQARRQLWFKEAFVFGTERSQALAGGEGSKR